MVQLCPPPRRKLLLHAPDGGRFENNQSSFICLNNNVQYQTGWFHLIAPIMSPFQHYLFSSRLLQETKNRLAWQVTSHTVKPEFMLSIYDSGNRAIHVIMITMLDRSHSLA
jgi:hypothetical protein